MYDPLSCRTADICNQLQRYGGIASLELADALDTLADINDDLHHGRDVSCVRQSIEKAKEQLDIVLKSAGR